MRFARRNLLGLSSAFVGLGTPAWARAPGGLMGRILALGKLRIGVWLDSGPYGHRGHDGQPAGMEVSVARDIARSLGVALELVPIGYGERVSAVALGYVDLGCATIIVTPDRLRRVAFAHPHGVVTTVLATTALRPIASEAELAGRRVIVRSSSILTVAPQIPRGAEALLVDDYNEGLALLLAGEAGGMILPEVALRTLALSHPAAQLHSLKRLSEASYAIALPLGEPDLLRFLNTWVFLREQDGTLAALHEDYLSAPRPEMPRL